MKTQSKTVQIQLGDTELSIDIHDKQSMDALTMLCRHAKVAGVISSFGPKTAPAGAEVQAAAVERTPFKVIQGGTDHPRRFPRFKKKFRILLISGIRTFHTYSYEISVGGMLLEKTLPLNFLQPQQKCKLLVCDDAHNIAFESELTEDQLESNRLRFTQLGTESGTLLGSWLERTANSTARNQMDSGRVLAGSLAI